jgi:hypothetical protein
MYHTNFIDDQALESIRHWVDTPEPGQPRFHVGYWYDEACISNAQHNYYADWYHDLVMGASKGALTTKEH